MTDLTRRGRVFIVQEPTQRGEGGGFKRKFDLTPAAVYGELTVLLAGNQSPLTAAPIVHELRKKLARFSDDDYLLAVGAPTFIGWATALAADANRGRVKMLVWDREARQYLTVTAHLWGGRPSSVDPLALRKVDDHDRQDQTDFFSR